MQFVTLKLASEILRCGGMSIVRRSAESISFKTLKERSNVNNYLAEGIRLWRGIPA
jgi:hypothetical protein